MIRFLHVLILLLAVVVNEPLISAESVQTGSASSVEVQSVETQARVQLLSNSKLVDALKQLAIKYQLSDSEVKAQALIVAAQPLTGQSSGDIYSGPLGIPEGEELLLSLHLEDLYLSDVFALKSKNNALFSLMGLFELIDFPIDVDVENHLVSGWYLDNRQQFKMVLPEDEATPLIVTVRGVTAEIATDDYVILGDDIYVSGDLIQTWFDFKFDYDFSDLSVELSSEQLLPVQQRLARQNKHLNEAGHRDRTPTLPWKESSYQAISSPLVDVQLNASFDKDTNYQSYSLLGSHDFAYLSSEFYASGNRNDALTDLRLTLSRESTDADLLGPLNATQYEIGDIVPVKIGIGDTPGLSRGVTFSNDAITRVSNNKTINISGDIQPGWDIELYQNGLLIGREFSLQNGRYEFNDIDLLYGDNQFEMIAYGPQGQVQTESKQVYVDGNKLKAKESSYNVSVAEQGKSLSGLSSMNKADEAGWVIGSTYEYGVTDWASVNFGLQELFSEENGTQSSYSIGTNFNLFKRFLFDADYQLDRDQFNTLQLTGRTQIGDQSLSMRFRSTDVADDVNERLTHTEYNVDHSGFLFKDSRYRLNYRNYWRRMDFDTGNNFDEFGNLLAMNTGLFTLNNQLTWRANSNDDSGVESSELSGVLQLQKSLGWVFSRLKMAYVIKPESEFTQATTQFSVPINQHLQSDLKFDYYPQTDLFKSQLGLNWQQETFSLNTNLNYDNKGEWSVGLYGRFSFGYEPNTQQLFMSSRSLSGSGALMVRVFEDENLNGQFDDGEVVIEGAKVKGVQQYRQAISNEDGVAMLTAMSNQVTTDIVLDQKTLGDPFLIPATPGVSVTPRRGHVQTLDFPVVNAGELEGTVYTRNTAGEEKVAAYALINLINATGDVVASTETEFDGYYLFVDLVPGDYKVSIDTSYLTRKKLHTVTPLSISLSNQGDVINGADFILEQFNFTKGYVVNLGKFNSLSILKTYWQLVRHHYDDSMNQQVFFMENEMTKQYELHVAFFKKQSQAERGCKHLSSIGLECSVEPFEFTF